MLIALIAEERVAAIAGAMPSGIGAVCVEGTTAY